MCKWIVDGVDMEALGVMQLDYAEELVENDFIEIAKRLGIHVKRDERERAEVYWSIDAGQGSGAAFNGTWQSHDGTEDFEAQVKDWAPIGSELNAIARMLDGASMEVNEAPGCVLRAYPTGYWRAGYGYRFDFEFDTSYWAGWDEHVCTCTGRWCQCAPDEPKLPEGVTDNVREALDKLAVWLYRLIEAEYDYLFEEARKQVAQEQEA